MKGLFLLLAVLCLGFCSVWAADAFRRPGPGHVSPAYGGGFGPGPGPAPGHFPGPRPGGYYGGGYDESPKPYDFNYAVTDEFGTTLNRQEVGDGSGGVRGSYGYTDANGLFRQVDYIADSYGFRANVRTNEPGTDNKNPADVNIHADPPPAGLVDRYGGYGRPHGGGGYSGGHHRSWAY